MSYRDNSIPDPRRFTTAPPVSITLSALSSPPQAGAADKIGCLSAILTAHHGAEAMISFATAAAKLHHAVRTVNEANEIVARKFEVTPPDQKTGEAAAEVTPECFAEFSAKIESAAQSYLAAADAVAELADSALLTPAILSGLPRHILASVIRAGLEAEAEELLATLEGITAPPSLEINISVTADTGPLRAAMEAVQQLQQEQGGEAEGGASDE